jgi:hypothetical protein
VTDGPAMCLKGMELDILMDTSGKCTDLLMYVHEKGVRLPTAHFPDGVGVDPIQAHCHGSAGP